MDDDKPITAAFTKNIPVLAVNKIGSGIVISDELDPYYYDDTVHLTAKSAARYALTGWSGAYTGIGTRTAAMTTTKPFMANFKKEFVKNSGFNVYPTTASKIPSNWTAANFAGTDGKNIIVRKEGVASVKITGAAGKVKTLTQTLTLGYLARKPFTFSFWVKGSFIPPTVGACMGQVTFYNGNTLLASQTKTITCPLGTYAFQKRTATFNVTETFTKVVIKFAYSKASGTVWFDAVSLLR